jgi:hypothetical protein
MSLDRAELIALRREAEDKFRRAEDDYQRDIQAIDRLLERFCIPSPVPQLDNPFLPQHLIPGGRPSELEAKIRDVMTRGNGPSPWSAPILYNFLKDKHEFPQQREGAVNGILSILKKWAARGIVHEQKGRGRRASLFIWDEAIYPKGPTNGGVHYAPIGMSLPTEEETRSATDAQV